MASISGTVFDDLNSNGIFNAGEPGIPGVYVVLEGPTLGNCINVQTDSNGNYIFDNINTPGSYTIYETVSDPTLDTCPPTVFTQPSDFTSSTTTRQISVNVTQANINNNTNLNQNNFGHDNVDIFGCESFAYQVAGEAGGASRLIRINLATGGFVNLGQINPQSSYNGIGYNNIDGNIWGYNLDSNEVARINANGNATLFDVPNLPNNTYNVGDVNLDGYLYLVQGNSNRFYVVDVNPNRATYGLLVDPANGFIKDTSPFGVPVNFPSVASDWAFNPVDNQLYTIMRNGNVRRIDPITGVGTTLTTSPNPDIAYGALFFDSENNLYGIRNQGQPNQGAIFKYEISGNNANGSLFSNSVAASSNDGARCPLAPVDFVDFQINKTAPAQVGVNDTITYTITLNNIGTTTATDVVFVDTIPNNTTFINESLRVNGTTIMGSPKPPGIVVNNLPVGLSTITFQVNADTLPNMNPVENMATIGYKYSDSLFSGSNNTNIAYTTIVDAILISEKSVNFTTAGISDELIYTITLRNTGNTTINSLTFTDTIPNNTTFVANSLTQDGTSIVGSPAPPSGIILSNPIGISQTSTITFRVIIDTLPMPNPIPNTATTTFTFIGDPSIPTIKNGNSNTNTVETLVLKADLSGITKAVDKTFAGCGNMLTYTITIPNTGNTTAENVILEDMVPNDTVFVQNSITINGISQAGITPNSIPIPNIAPGSIVTVTFSVIVPCE